MGVYVLGRGVDEGGKGAPPNLDMIHLCYIRGTVSPQTGACVVLPQETGPPLAKGQVEVLWSGRSSKIWHVGQAVMTMLWVARDTPEEIQNSVPGKLTHD